MSRIAVFGYGSLVAPASAALTLARPVERVWTARLPGWRRGFNQARDNRRAEKTFALTGDGSVPDFVLGLGVEPDDDPGFAPNGALIELTAAELDRLDLREIRYDRVDVSAQIEAGGAAPTFDAVVTYRPKPERRAPEPPPGSVILASYARAVEAAFGALGEDELAEYRRTTLPYPAPVVEAALVRDEIPEGNPREW